MRALHRTKRPCFGAAFLCRALPASEAAPLQGGRQSAGVQGSRSLAWAAALLLQLAWYVPEVRAESLRCGGGLVAEGDSRLAVSYKCGEPVARDSFCAALVDPATGWAHAPQPGLGLPCQPIDEWLYDRGPGNLMATVRFRNGLVQSISYGRVPR